MAQTINSNSSECLVSKEISTQEIIEKLKSNTNANVRTQNQQGVEIQSPKIVESQSIQTVENQLNESQSVRKHSEENFSTNSEANQNTENNSVVIQNNAPENVDINEEPEQKCPCGKKFPSVILKEGGQLTKSGWVECETCLTWYHSHCAGIIQKSGESLTTKTFTCSPCIVKQVELLKKNLSTLNQNSCLNFDSHTKSGNYKVKQKKADRTYAETKLPPEEDKKFIVIVDSVTRTFNSSVLIKQEIAKYYKEIEIKHCYQLVRGGIAIHVNNEESEKTLLNTWPTGAFGTPTKLNSHKPTRSKNIKSIVIKQVDPKLDHKEICEDLKERYNNKDIRTRRFYKNRNPLSIVKVTATTDLINQWLDKEVILFDQVKPCEKYRYKYIPTRCYTCQRFGHTSKICFSLPRCAKCGKDHLTADCEETTPFCVNCKSDHTADDPQCLSFLSRQRKGAERRRKEKENNFNTNSQNIDY